MGRARTYVVWFGVGFLRTGFFGCGLFFVCVVGGSVLFFHSCEGSAWRYTYLTGIRLLLDHTSLMWLVTLHILHLVHLTLSSFLAKSGPSVSAIDRSPVFRRYVWAFPFTVLIRSNANHTRKSAIKHINEAP
jgi:hypothetical protein